MAFTYHELKEKNVADLREIAKGIEHEAVQGYTQLNKEHLLVGARQGAEPPDARASRSRRLRQGGDQGEDAGPEEDAGRRDRGGRPHEAERRPAPHALAQSRHPQAHATD